MWTFCYFFFFFNDTATTEIYTLSLHDALPISVPRIGLPDRHGDLLPRRAPTPRRLDLGRLRALADRKSTRLNSSHANISYAVFCLKKKKIEKSTIRGSNHCMKDIYTVSYNVIS